MRSRTLSKRSFELLPEGSGTRLVFTVFTDQGAYFKGADRPALREEGWSKLLAQMDAQLSSPAGK